MTGVFVESGDDSHKGADAVHAVEDWSDDENHIKPIRDSTLYYNDLLVAKFKGHHKDDGRTPEHTGKRSMQDFTGCLLVTLTIYGKCLIINMSYFFSQKGERTSSC